MDFFNEIWATITKNRSRSLLTGFGVFWGITILLVLVGLGNSMTNGIQKQIEGTAINSCFISSDYTSKPYMGFPKGRYWAILNSDLPILRRECPSADVITGICFAGQWDNNVHYGDKVGTYSLTGIAPEYPQVTYVPLLYGRYINQHDIDEKRKVCVIGNTIYQELFPDGFNPIGQMIYVGNIPFHIIGVKKVAPSGVNLGGYTDEQLNMPITVLQHIYNQGETVHAIFASSKKGIPAAMVQDEVKATLKKIHRIAPDDQRAVWAMNFEENFNAINLLIIGVTILIWLIGIGTLISGAVGVSNIMLITVRERTKEIGIRRAIGANPFVIVRQILAESTLLTFLAGVLGIVASVGLLQLINPMLAGNEVFSGKAEVDFATAIGALILLTIVGLLAGLLPANRALSIKPIEALNEE